MKLKEIINESMALKFDSLEKKIRSSSMTVSQFKKLLYHEYDVYAILELNNNYEPFTANGASISTRRHDTTTDDEVLPPEAHGKYIMHIGVGPTRVKIISALMMNITMQLGLVLMERI